MKNPRITLEKDGKKYVDIGLWDLIFNLQFRTWIFPGDFTLKLNEEIVDKPDPWWNEQ
jgi:hypothetical protein